MRYAAGSITPEEYRREADGLGRQAVSLDQEMHGRKEELLKPEEEMERLEADMKQVIRYSHMEKLSQELVETFAEKIYVYKDKRVEIEWKININGMFEMLAGST